MKTSRYSDIRIRGILKQAEVGLLINFQDTHRKNVAAYIKKLGLRFSIIVGVLVNTDTVYLELATCRSFSNYVFLRY